MDPNACFVRFLNARTYADKIEAALDLLAWLATGGFEPSHAQWAAHDTRPTPKQWTRARMQDLLRAHDDASDACNDGAGEDY